MGEVAQEILDPEKNQEAVLRLFRMYYRAHQNSGKVFEELPEFFLVRPDTFYGQDLMTRASDKLILDDCIQRATARQGHVGVNVRLNEKLKYYWLELAVYPFVVGDAVTDDNKHEFFLILSHFIDFTKHNPKLYGDLTAEIDSDKDLALMLKEINRLGEALKGKAQYYPLDSLLRFNATWPITEVKKLLVSLRDNDQSWCEVFSEYLLYVMSRKE